MINEEGRGDLENLDSEESLPPDRLPYLKEAELQSKIANEYLRDVINREAFWKAVAKGDFSVKQKLSPEKNLESIEIRDREGKIWFFMNFVGIKNISDRLNEEGKERLV